jgi:hypothetical protein
MKLEADDFRTLIDILKKHPDFNSPQERVLLLKRAFKGSDRGNALLSIINSEGNPRAAATEVLAKVAEFGQLDYARPALGVFLASIQDDVGDDEAGFIKGLFEKYPLDAQPLRARPVASWRDPGEDPTEKIIGENTLLPIAVFEAAVAAARAVVRVRVKPAGEPGWVGTGFLVSGNRIMTCNHVIRSRDDLGATTCEFNYQLDVAGRELRVTEVRPSPDGGFQTDPALDFSVFELPVAIAPDLAAPVRFAKRGVREGQRVALIQHPGGPAQGSLHAPEPGHLCRPAGRTIRDEHRARLVRLSGVRQRDVRGRRRAQPGRTPPRPGQGRHLPPQRGFVRPGNPRTAQGT